MLINIFGHSPLETAAGTHVGVQVELLAQGQVQRAMTLADGRHQGTLQADFVPVHAVDGRLGDSESAVGVLQGRANKLEWCWVIDVGIWGLTRTGVTSTVSHSMGTPATVKIFWTAAEISGPMPSPGIRVTFGVPEAKVLALTGDLAT